MPLFQRESPDTTLECPHDRGAMDKVAVDGVRVDRCTTCGGTWFDANELRRVAHDKEIERLASRVPLVTSMSPFACPRCGGECVEGHVAEVNVDTCTKCHGVWLDRGELTEAKRQLQVGRVLAGQGDGFRGFLARI